jgi:preprotein translocase subunit SecE
MTETRGSVETRGSSAAAPQSKRPRFLSRVAGRFARIPLFYRQVIAELRKVIWPTRHELVTYTSVVVVFVSIIIAIVFSLDYGFGKAVLYIFG